MYVYNEKRLPQLQYNVILVRQGDVVVMKMMFAVF